MNILGTTKISNEIENILSEAEDFLILVSPYWQVSKRLKVRLSDSFKKVEDVLIIYRANINHYNSTNKKSFDDEINDLNKFKNVEQISIKNLHSKIYLNEKKCLITSMNLYEYSQINNHEIGVLIDSKDNLKEYVQVLDEIRVMIENEHQSDILNQLIERFEDYTMRKLFRFLTENYKFENYTKWSDELYQYLSDNAVKIVEFKEFELYQDKTAILRSTKLGKMRYDILKKKLKELAI